MIAATAQRECFPELEAEINEDPAAFLDRELVERGPSHTTKTAHQKVKARIRGIDRIDVVDAWIYVETSIERGPRQQVLAWLNQRKKYLEEVGERPDLLATPVDERPERYHEHDRDLPGKPVVIIDESGEEIPYDEARSSTAAAQIRAKRGDVSE